MNLRQCFDTKTKSESEVILRLVLVEVPQTLFCYQYSLIPRLYRLPCRNGVGRGSVSARALLPSVVTREKHVDDGAVPAPPRWRTVLCIYLVFMVLLIPIVISLHLVQVLQYT